MTERPFGPPQETAEFWRRFFPFAVFDNKCQLLQDTTCFVWSMKYELFDHDSKYAVVKLTHRMTFTKAKNSKEKFSNMAQKKNVTKKIHTREERRIRAFIHDNMKQFTCHI